VLTVTSTVRSVTPAKVRAPLGIGLKSYGISP
jgi:hypothetical protein